MLLPWTLHYNIALSTVVLDSIVVSIPACHAGDRGSIPRRGGHLDLVYDIFVGYC